MGEIIKTYKVKLVSGILFSPSWCNKHLELKNATIEEISKHINSILEKNLSNLLNSNIKVDLQSEIEKFNSTTYYNDEIGEEIFRYWVSFSPILYANNLFKIKLLSNGIEKNFFSDNQNNRKVNIDPGYIDASKLVLFSTKNYSHRVYLEEGIFAEVTLIYKNKNFQTLEWTYPDYRKEKTIEFFKKVRANYLETFNF